MVTIHKRAAENDVWGVPCGLPARESLETLQAALWRMALHGCQADLLTRRNLKKHDSDDFDVMKSVWCGMQHTHTHKTRSTSQKSVPNKIIIFTFEANNN